MPRFRCTYVNPTKKPPTPCAAVIEAKSAPGKGTPCSVCGRKNTFEEIVEVKDWKCSELNSGTGQYCTGTTQTAGTPKIACPVCGKKNKWVESTVVLGPIAWPNPLPTALQEALNGTYQPADNNAIPPAGSTACNTTYGQGKHWGGGGKKWKDAGQYDLTDVGPTVVCAMEDKAVRLGLETAGGWVFRFNADVGHTCRTDSELTRETTSCIRVDSGTTVATGRHSHPIPELGGLQTSSHEKEVKNVIIDAVNALDVGRLTAVARYLKLIGAGNKHYSFSIQENGQLKKPLPASIFW